MGRSALDWIRRLPSGKNQARVRSQEAHVSLGSYRTRREALAGSPLDAAASLASDAASCQRTGEFAERWWSSRAGRRASTRARDRLILDHDLLPCLGEVALGDVSRAAVRRFLAELSSRPLSPSSVRRLFRSSTSWSKPP